VTGQDDGWDLIELEFGDVESLAEEMVGLGPSVLAVHPPELRESVVRRLRAVAEVVAR
jgi:proteasome accessory factor B